MLRTLGGDSYTTSVVRISLAFEDALDRPELTANLLHHVLCSASYGIHRQTAEQERHHRADEDTYQHHGVHQIDIIGVHEIHECCFRCLNAVRQRLAGTDESYLDLLYIRSQERQCGECRRTDSKTLAGSSCRVA